MRFKALRGSPKEKALRGQYLLAVDLDHYINSPFNSFTVIASFIPNGELFAIFHGLGLEF